MKKKPLIIIAGPTAVGKTKYSIEFAKRNKGSVVSADSMQVYRGMDIGSAKITPEEMQGIPHYLVDILDPRDEFNVAVFCEKAKAAIDDIHTAGRLPMLVGGTGFYIRALLYGADFSYGQEDEAYRDELTEFVAEHGEDALHEKLQAVDPVAAGEIHPNNVKRVIRALEFYHVTGRPISEHNEAMHQKEADYDFVYFVITDDRPKIYEGIDRRVDMMFDAGLYDEVKRLYDMGLRRGTTSMQGIGYKEVLDAIEGQTTIERAREIIKRDTRHFAKRQLTWFKREVDVVWVDKSKFNYDDEKILRFMEDTVKKSH
ncbi:MAG: tRNA (adenosine(37)-N6)-dimethylallyltransferase MiaA [Lachnospiraceae bacterium]|nr:tRNA (adenosine(37)-N6)-dimethylallyltransferase MiaA [Lachnospiraceae bacterium]